MGGDGRVKCLNAQKQDAHLSSGNWGFCGKTVCLPGFRMHEGPAICNLQPAILLSAARPWRNTGRYSTTANQVVSRPDARHIICPLWCCAEDRSKLILRLLGRPSTSPMPTSAGVSKASRKNQMPSIQDTCSIRISYGSQRGLIALGGSLSLADNRKPQLPRISSLFGPERWLVLRDGLMICFCNQRYKYLSLVICNHWST